MTNLQNIDPAWAWKPYRPSRQSPWNRRRSAHFYRRAGFAATSAELDAAVKKDPAELVRDFIQAGRESATFLDEVEEMTQFILNTGEAKNLSAAWMYRLLGTPDQLTEKLTIFWHGHFATSAAKVTDPKLMHKQIQMLRKHSTGDFGKLVQRISQDPAMLLYLDSATNRKSHPNENYARELMELFCMGEGNYSEKDVQELARCFTGWEVVRGRFRFRRFQHDSGNKTVLGTKGRLSGQQAVDVVLKHQATPRFIVRKLIKYFLFDEPVASNALIEPLAKYFREKDLQVAPLIAKILNSQLFHSDQLVGQKIRSPVEMAIGVLRALHGTTDAYMLANGVTELGQGLYYPPNVKGWDGGRAWINSSTLLGRANLMKAVLQNGKTRFDGGKIDKLADRYKLKSSKQIVAWLLEQVCAVPVPQSAQARLIDVADTAGGNVARKMLAVAQAACTLPEIHLT